MGAARHEKIAAPYKGNESKSATPRKMQMLSHVMQTIMNKSRAQAQSLMVDEIHRRAGQGPNKQEAGMNELSRRCGEMRKV